MTKQVRLRARRIGIMPHRTAERGVHQPDVDPSRLRRRIARQEAGRDVPAVEAEPMDRSVADVKGRPAGVQQHDPFVDRPVARMVEQRVMIAPDHHGPDAGPAKTPELACERRPARHVAHIVVEDVPGQKQRRHLVLDRGIDEPRKNPPRSPAQALSELRIAKRLRPERRVEMEICCVKKPHGHGDPNLRAATVEQINASGNAAGRRNRGRNSESSTQKSL